MSRLRGPLRVLALVLLGLAGALNLMGGIGTSCVAFAPERFGPRMALLAPYQWAYIIFVIAGTATALWEVKALWDLARRRPSACVHAIWSLAAGAAVAGVHAATSFALRGSGAPADWRFYVTALALAAFVLLRWAGVFRRAETPDGSEDPEAPPGADPADPGSAAGPALVGMSLVVLSIQHWIASTHTIDGVNYGDVWHVPLLVCGVAGLAAAAWLMTGRGRAGRRASRHHGGSLVNGSSTAASGRPRLP